MTATDWSLILSALSFLVAAGSLLVAARQTADAKRSAQRALEVAFQLRADPVKHAVYTNVIQGLQEVNTTVAELIAEKDAFVNDTAARDYGAAHERTGPTLKHLEILRMKWLPFLPPQFILESDRFVQAYKDWMIAIREAHVEGMERPVELDRMLNQSRRTMIAFTQDFTNAKHLLEQVNQIVEADKTTGRE